MGLESYDETNSESSSKEEEDSSEKTTTCGVQQSHETVEPNGKYIDAISIQNQLLTDKKNIILQTVKLSQRL